MMLIHVKKILLEKLVNLIENNIIDIPGRQNSSENDKIDYEKMLKIIKQME